MDPIAVIVFPNVLFQSHGAKLYRVPRSSPLTFFSKLFVISHELSFLII